MKGKDLTIKARVIITVGAIFLISSAVMAMVTYTSQMDQLRDSITEKVKSDLNLIPTQIEADAEGLSRALAGFTRLDNLLQPFAERNREKLAAAVKPVFEDLKARNNITHMYFILPDGEVFFRGHQPAQNGDRLTRITYKRASETNKLASGIEMGKNFFSLRAVQPVSYNGRPIGYMELGQEIDHIFKKVSEITGDDVSVFLTEEFRKSKSSELNKERVGKFMLLDSTHKEAGLNLAEKVDLEKGLKEMAVFDVSVKGSRYAAGVGPLKDASGVLAGVLLFEHEVDELYSTIRKNILTVIVLFGLLLAGSVVVFYLSIRRSLALFSQVSASARKIAEGDLDVEVTAERNDEVGELANAFKRMIDYLKGLAIAAEDIAAGDLRTDVAPKSNKDVLGNAFRKMVEGLRGLVTEVKEGADQIAASSQQIASTSEQAAKNNETAATGVEETTSTMHEMSANIQNVAKNSQTQASSVTETSASVEQMVTSIQRIANTAKQFVELSQKTKKAVDAGLEAVDKSVKGTDEINRSIIALGRYDRGARHPGRGHRQDRGRDRRDRGTDEPAGPERGHRGGPGRRAGHGLRGRGRGSAKARGAFREIDQGDRGPDLGDPEGGPGSGQGHG